MTKKIQYTDFFILRDLFFSKDSEILILDDEKEWQSAPGIHVITDNNKALEEFYNPDNIGTGGSSTKFVVLNFSKLPLYRFYHNPNLEGIIDFTNENERGFQSYYFLNNPDQTMRWIFPRKCKSPAFLHLYNGSGMKAKVFKKAAKMLHAIDCLQTIVSGQFSIFRKNKTSFDQHFSNFHYDDFAIFTGTVGENRKAIIALAEKRKCTQFLKIPMTDAAQDLVSNEYRQLKNIATQKFETLIAPQIQRTATGIAVSNVQPEKFAKNNSFGKIHLQALGELYQNSAQEKRVGELSMWETIANGMKFFTTRLPQLPTKSEAGEKFNNGLSVEKTIQLQNACENIFYNIDFTETIKVGMAHGDFTPWNMYVCKEKLHVYDWEMCVDDAPLLFDVFHYVFQKGILIDRKPMEAILQDLENILVSPEARTIIEKYSLDWKVQFQFYLLYIVTYYLPKYIVQPQLHDQVHWLVDTWVAALGKVKIAEEV